MFHCNPYLFMKGDEVICSSCKRNVFVNKDVPISDERKLVKCSRCGAYVSYGKLQKVNNSEVKKMKTKREVLKLFSQKGFCVKLDCTECPYKGDSCPKYRKELNMRLAKIGAMAILRMFRKKKNRLICVDDFPPYIKSMLKSLKLIVLGFIEKTNNLKKKKNSKGRK